MLELRKITTKKQIETAFNIYKSNPYYFQKTKEMNPTLDSVYEDRSSIPPNLEKKQKIYALLEFDGKEVGVIDLLKFYPQKNTHFIGLFILDRAIHGQGYGSLIMKELENRFSQDSVDKIRLAAICENDVAMSFWKNQGFTIIEKKKINLTDKLSKQAAIFEKNI